MKLLRASSLLFVFGLSGPLSGFSQRPVQSQPGGVRPLPAIVRRGDRYGLIVDEVPYLVLGAQINNSSAFESTMPLVWPAVEALQVNTIEAPVYWEEMERERGHYNFAQVDMLVQQSRTHGVRLILLWFATWKNGSGHYIPQWMKQQEAAYPHVLSSGGSPVDSLSPHAEATQREDRNAFAALMQHLKATDAAHTVIMVQVENEPGTYGAVRDHSPAAERLFQQNVPESVLRGTGATGTGSWKTVFGDQADGFFHAWAIANFIEQVAAAGKAVYDLPLYVNVALRDPIHPGKQGSWESGGATDDVLGLWRAVAPHIDLLAPDIYSPESAKYRRTLDLYSRADNPLLVPETGRQPRFARYCFAAIGHGALGWTPFGIDATSDYSSPEGTSEGAARLDAESLAPFRYNFALLRPISGLIAQLSLAGKVQGVAEDDGPAPHLDHMAFGDWDVDVTYGRPHFGEGRGTGANTPVQGEALVAQLGPDEYLVAGYAARIVFQPAGKLAGRHRQFLAVEEGTYVKDKWVRTRIWNGDQTDYGLNFATSPRLLRVTLSTY